MALPARAPDTGGAGTPGASPVGFGAMVIGSAVPFLGFFERFGPCAGAFPAFVAGGFACPLWRLAARSRLGPTCGDAGCEGGGGAGAKAVAASFVRRLSTGAHGPLVHMAGCVRPLGTSS